MRVLVLGGAGFIGSHLAKSYFDEGHFVEVVDIQSNQFFKNYCTREIIADLRDNVVVNNILKNKWDIVHQMAADMGGAGYINSGINDHLIVPNSISINANIARNANPKNVKLLFFASSACVYRQTNQLSDDHVNCSEGSEYPAEPDTEYGWEKLFSERLFTSLAKNVGVNVKIGRFHNVFGPHGCWDGGKEKFPAALCRKIAHASNGGEIELWGDGAQKRSFMYIDDAVIGVRKLCESRSFNGPVNLGCETMFSIKEMFEIVKNISGKSIIAKYISGPVGVAARKSDNKLINQKLSWAPSENLKQNIRTTYEWVESQIQLHKI